MEVMDEVLPDSITEQQAQFEKPEGPAGGGSAAGSTNEEQKPQRQQ